MNSQKLIIYDYIELFNILNELKNDLNIKILKIPKDDLSNLLLKNNENNLIITQKKISQIEDQIIVNILPIKIFKLVEKFNIEFLKKKFGQQSEIDVGNYKINLNSRELMFNKKKIKLTEKESSIILYLSKYKKAISIEELQFKVWGHQSELETHTVETHVYRLRKKISKMFNDKNFIISKKNGYQIS
jgi:DNA-binding response OmpR family regulator